MRAHQWRSYDRRNSGADTARGFFPGPCHWEAGTGAFEAALPFLKELEAPLLWVGESALLKKWLDRWEGPMAAAGLRHEPHFWQAGTECCEEAVAAILQNAVSIQAKGLLGLGGGKCMDTVKWAAARSGLPFVLIPSSPATCACATQVVVCYDAQGRYLNVLELEASAKLLIIDAAVMASAPKRLWAAGLMDTLAKPLEAQAAGLESGYGSSTGGFLAQEAWDLCQAQGFAWLQNIPDAAEASAAALEGMLLTTGLASAVGGVPAAAAHSLSNGLSVLPKAKQWLHGELVGWGLLYQESLLQALGRPSKPCALILEDLGLPMKIPGDLLERDRASEVVQKMMAEGESIHAIKGIQSLGEARLLEILLALREP
jgi:glycerol dehydrogenase